MREADVQRLERLLAALMLRGVQFSAACLVLGLGLWLADGGPPHAMWLLTTGLIALMATPMLRVGVSVAEAIRLRDWFFVVTTAAVALLLSLSVTYALLTRG